MAATPPEPEPEHEPPPESDAQPEPAEPAQGRGASSEPSASESKGKRQRSKVEAKAQTKGVEGRKLYLPEDVFFRLRLLAYQRGQTLSETATEVLDKSLPRWNVERTG